MKTEQKYNKSGLCLCGCGQGTKILDSGNFNSFVQYHHQKGILHHNWQGGCTKSGNGYIWVRLSGHPRATQKGCYVFEHILYAEKILGKYLPLKSVVHHINGNKTKQERNLVICEDDSYHVLLHQRQRAFEACGHAKWLKCVFCQQYDDPKNLKIIYTQGKDRNHCSKYHLACQRQVRRQKREMAKRENSRDMIAIDTSE